MGSGKRSVESGDEELLPSSRWLPSSTGKTEGPAETDDPLYQDSAVIKCGWLLKKGSRTNAPTTAKWKRRWCVLKMGVLYYDPTVKVGGFRKQVALEHTQVSIDHYAGPTESHAAGPIVVLSLFAPKRKMRQEGELRFMAENEPDGLDWLHAIDFQVASAKRRSEEKLEEGFEALASFLRHQRCRQDVKSSILRGRSKYTGDMDAYLHVMDPSATLFGPHSPAPPGPSNPSHATGGAQPLPPPLAPGVPHTESWGPPSLAQQQELLASDRFYGSHPHGPTPGPTEAHGPGGPHHATPVPHGLLPASDAFLSQDSSGSGSHLVGIPESDIPVPRLNVVIMLVGTRGDVQPFLYLARRLRTAHGHNVRVATHAVYREMVEREGLLFYPLAGDPVKLSEYMVRSQGRIIPDLLDRREMREIPEKMLMLRDILYSTWPACTAPDPADPSRTPFVADAIISNPVTYGHIHCAEALGAPLHLMFPQPWLPTHAFPHPLANLPFSRGWCTENLLSYFFVEEFMWLSLGRFVNRFRLSLGLDAIRRGEAGANLLVDNQVPFVKMWSPSFVPKPRDWGPHVDVVGYFLEEKGPITPRRGGSRTGAPDIQLRREQGGHSEPVLAGLEAGETGVGDEGKGEGTQEGTARESREKEREVVFDPRLPKELVAWLQRGDMPIFVGFGSMVIEDTTKLSRTIVDAARQAHVRVVVQSSWSKMGTDALQPGDEDIVFLLGDCPHVALMPHMAAVVHHGGAGTAAAGLQAGKPTMVCPFFGDQFFWGEMVVRAGVGVAPIPIQLLTSSLAASFEKLTDPQLTVAAQAMQRRILAENGVRGAAEAFRKHLPVQNMVCDVSLFLDETMVARKWCDQCEMKMSVEVDRVVHRGKHARHNRNDYRFVDWGVVGPPDIATGLIQGFSGAAQELVGALAGVVEEPVRGAIENGALGAAQGLATGVLNLVRRPLRGGVILIEKISVGVCNQVERGLMGEPSLRRPKRYLFDRTNVKWVTPACCSLTDAQAAGHGDTCDDISEQRKQEILKAYQLVKSAHRALHRLQRLARRSEGGVLRDVRVWWASFVSLLQSSVFYRILVEDAPPSPPSTCLAGCSPKPAHKASRQEEGEECKDHESLPPAPAEQSSWLSTWTTDQIKRYIKWYTRRGGDEFPQDTAKPAAAKPVGPEAAASARPVPLGESCMLTVGSGSSDGSLRPHGSVDACVPADHVERHTSESVRTEVEVALTKALDLRPEAAQELAASLERAGIAHGGAEMNVVDFLWVFSRVLRRQDKERRRVARQEAAIAALHNQAVQEEKRRKAGLREGKGPGGWERIAEQDWGLSSEEEGEEGEEGNRPGRGLQRESSFPPALDELFRTYSR